MRSILVALLVSMLLGAVLGSVAQRLMDARSDTVSASIASFRDYAAKAEPEHQAAFLRSARILEEQQETLQSLPVWSVCFALASGYGLVCTLVFVGARRAFARRKRDVAIDPA
jgi:hypothetical protein